MSLPSRRRPFDSWSNADKCIVATLVALVAQLYLLAILLVRRRSPAAQSYLDPAFAENVLVPLLYALLPATIAILVAALIARRRAPGSTVLVRTTTLFMTLLASLTQLFGPYTTPLLASVLVGVGPVGLFLFGRRAILLPVVCYLAVLLGATAAEQAGWIPYAPAIRSAPFAHGGLAPSWIFGVGGFSLALALLCGSLTFVAIARIHADEAMLLAATIDVGRTNDEIQAANARLARAYEQRASTQAQLVQSERLASLGQLVAGVAHELRNPASFVEGGLASLRPAFEAVIAMLAEYRHAATTEPALAEATAELQARVDLEYLERETPELLRICDEGATRIRRIVDDLRIFTRADSGRREQVEVGASIDAALDALREPGRMLGILVRRDFGNAGEVPARVAADRSQLLQLWRSLLSNSIDALDGRSNPEIRITVRASDMDRTPGIRIEIEDNGCGIAPESLQRIFEPFFSTKPVGSGTGLGLSIAYGVVSSLGGEIAVTSEPGRGTRVVVGLPVGPRADVG